MTFSTDARQIWKSMNKDMRSTLLLNLYQSDNKDAAMDAQAMDMLLAQQMKFRPQSMKKMSLDNRVGYLSRMPNMDPGVVLTLLGEYHFGNKVELMSNFLDALGISHEKGMVETYPDEKPTADAIKGAVKGLKEQESDEAINLYLQTVYVSDEEFWENVPAACE